MDKGQGSAPGAGNGRSEKGERTVVSVTLAVGQQLNLFIRGVVTDDLDGELIEDRVMLARHLAERLEKGRTLSFVEDETLDCEIVIPASQVSYLAVMPESLFKKRVERAQFAMSQQRLVQGARS